MLRGRFQELLRLASRIIVGAGVYVVIVVLATPLPAAAGLMLTFPALNGLAFFFSEDARAASLARTMFWMPVVNGTLCAAYMLLFFLFAKAMSPAGVGWGLLVAVIGLWFAWVSRQTVRAGIDRTAQLKFGFASTLIGVAFTALALLVMFHFEILPRETAFASQPENWGWIADAIGRSKLKIALFAVTLAFLLSAIAYWPMTDSTRGILAGLPLVPFGGLVSVGADPALSADSRLAIFLGMIGSIWLGPSIAVWFIFCFSRYLGARKRLGSGAADALLRFGALVLGWLVTFAVIVAIASAMKALGVHQRLAMTLGVTS